MNLSKFALILILNLLCFTFFQCKKESNDSTNDRIETKATDPIRVGKLVMAEGGLNARETPAIDGKFVFLISNYTVLEVAEDIGEEIEINDKIGKWTKIQYEGKSGYVFGGYIINAIIEKPVPNPTGNLYYIFYSIPEFGKKEPSNCRGNYMQAGCLVVVYKSSNKEPIHTLADTEVEGWIDKEQLAISWSIGDAGYGGEGINSVNVYTKEQGIELWRHDTNMKMEEPYGGKESDVLCLKTFCFDLLKNPDLIGQIKTTRGLKFYEAGQAIDTGNDYSTKISIGENKFILFFPGKNVVIGQ